MKFTDNMLAEARLAKSAEELLALAEKNDIEMTVEEAEANFAVLGGKTGELADDELDNVAGGACRYKDGRPVVTVAHDCSNWCCKHDGSEEKIKPMGALDLQNLRYPDILQHLQILLLRKRTVALQ